MQAHTHGVTAAGTGCGLELPPVALSGWQPSHRLSHRCHTHHTLKTLDCDRDGAASRRLALFRRWHRHFTHNIPLRYITSMYWAYTTMTTVGYGDISSTTLAEKIWAIITMIVSGFFFSFVVGRMASIVAKLDSHRTAYNERMEVVTAFLKDTNLPRPLEKRCAVSRRLCTGCRRKRAGLPAATPGVMISCDKEAWCVSPAVPVRVLDMFKKQSTKPYDRQAVLGILPFELKAKILRHLYAGAIRDVPLLRNIADDDLFMTDMCIRLQPYTCSASTFVYQRGEAQPGVMCA